MNRKEIEQEVEAFVESYKKYLAELGKKKGAKAA